MTRRVWRMQDGLPDDVISAGAETREHYLWLGTPRSLIRFDGFHFLDMSAEISPSIHEFGVTCLFTARDGSLWIGTGDSTLMRVRGTVVQTYGAKSGLRAFNVRVLRQDAAGVLWAGTDQGIYRFVEKRFQRIPHIGDPSVHAIISDGDGGLWIGGHDLIHYAGGVFRHIALPKQKMPTRIEALARTPDGTLWIGTLGGLLHMNAKGVISAQVSVAREVSVLVVDRDHRLWVGTLNGGLFLRRASDRFAHIAEATEGVSSTVLALLSDESGDLWVGTHSGLARLTNTGMQLVAIPALRNAQHASITRDTDGSLWICAGEVFHLVNRTVHEPKLPLVGDFPVRAMMRDSAGSLWIGTAGGGAIRVPQRGKPEQYAAKVGTSYITGFLQGENGDVWIATEAGIAVWRRGNVVSFQHIPGSPHQPVLSLADAESGGVWIGSSHGLLRLRNGRFISDPAISALGSHPVRALYTSSDGVLWIGTESGLFRWRDDRMLHVPLEDDGRSQDVESILEDPLGRLWLGGPDRVRRIKRATIDRVLDSDAGTSAAFPAHAGEGADAIVPKDFDVSTETGAELYGGMPSSSAPDAHDGAWYISDAGPVDISGNNDAASKSAPPVVLQQIVVDGRRLPLSHIAMLSLPPSTKTLEIEATPVVLGSHAGLQIRRKLIGFDKSWYKLPVSHVATYTNLPAGNYIYRVEVSWGNWQEASSLELRVVQQAHFYQKWWFLTLCAILISMVAWLLHLQKLRQLAARFSAVAEERNRIAREVHDTILQGCIGISYLLDGIASSSQQRQETEQSYRPGLPERGWAALQLARAEVERTIHEARIAIWNLRRNEPEAQLDQSLRELCNKMTGNQPIPATFQSSGPSLRLAVEQQREILMTVREALQNAIKHAGGSKVAVCLRYMTNLVRIEITDEGRGISQGLSGSNIIGHFGVVGMRERMAEIGGTCQISSAEGKGTTVTLEIPVDSPLQGGTKSK